MPGIMNNEKRVSTALSVGSRSSQGHGKIVRRGAVVLLILLAAALMVVALYSRRSEAQPSAAPVANSHSVSHSVTVTPAVNNAKEATVKPTEPSMESTNTSSNASTGANPSVSASVQVNGRHIDVPVNGGTVHQETVESNGSKTTVDVSVDSTTNGTLSTSGSSSFNLNVQSNQVSGSEAGQ